MIKKFAILLMFFLAGCAEDPANRTHEVESSSSSSIVQESCPNSSVGLNTLTCGGQTYRTVEIGDQTWMAENLNYAAEGSVCYDNADYNCDKYGRLYNWETAKKVCPEGWHLPYEVEFEALSSYIDPEGEGDAMLLKAASGWGSGNGLDSYEFSALPGGSCNYNGNCVDIGYRGSWWSGSGNNEYNVTYWQINRSSNHTNLLYEYSAYLFSVRCVRN